MAIQKPLLAASLKKLSVDDLTFPVYATPKLDGIRAPCNYAIFFQNGR
ncbi:DNA ligase [Acanthocystis turfacea Chlorella virus NTS-1]|nr:DNA ligase [Acanthocystis turfacea Chlorella virus NTS-1]